MRAVLAQECPRSRDLEGNVARARELLAASAGADVLVLPELFLSGYQLERLEEIAVELDGPQLSALAEAARTAGAGVVLGLVERVAGGFANSAVCIDAAGRLAGVYRKAHLFGAEREAFVAGGELRPLEVDGRRPGLAICFDVEFPEVARTLAVRGADHLITISANMTPFATDHDLFVRARALESGLPHLYVNRSGGELGERFVGGSQAVDPEGRVIAHAGAEPAVLSVELPPGGRADSRLSYLGQRRLGLYET